MSESNSDVLSGNTPTYPLFGANGARKVAQNIIQSGIDDYVTIYDLGTFEGRISELDQIKKAFSFGKKVVVLHGMGGIGKTFLALKYAVNNEDDVNAYQVIHLKDGIENVLIQYTNIEYIEYIARYIRFTQEVEVEIEKQLALFPVQCDEKRSRLRAEKLKELTANTLLIIDNYNDLDEKGLSSIVASLNCKVILTTRKNIDKKYDAVEYIHVKPPQEEDALKIFQANSEHDISEDDKTILQNIFKNYIGYHTMAIVILAKLHKTQKKRRKNEWTLKKLEADMAQYGFVALKPTVGSITKTGEKPLSNVSPSEILERLFDFSKIGEEETEILRLLSLISPSVSVSFNDVNELLALNDDDSKLFNLSDSGWIVCEEPNFQLQHVISEMLVQQVDPMKKNAATLID
jgi:GTPase SAR1 family protein